MIRKLLTIVLPLLAPTILYFMYLWTQRRREEAEAGGRPIPAWQEWPWAWLLGSGCVLMVATLLVLELPGRKDRESDYVPPRLEDGRIVPGGHRGAE